jgi:hypothetical protein
VLALVTWAQRDDPHWFGARIPDMPRSVEFLQVGTAGQTSFQSFTGTALTQDHPTASGVTQRTSFMLGLAPAQLP